MGMAKETMIQISHNAIGTRILEFEIIITVARTAVMKTISRKIATPPREGKIIVVVVETRTMITFDAMDTETVVTTISGDEKDRAKETTVAIPTDTLVAERDL